VSDVYTVDMDMASKRRTSAARRDDSVSAGEVSRQAILRAAERCVEHYGIRKTTMEDVAREAGISRPSVYRYFGDRRDLLVAVAIDHAQRLTEKARQFIERQPTFEDGLAGGILYLATHGRRDEFARYLYPVDEAMPIADRASISEIFADVAGQFWDPFLDAAEASGELRSGLDRSEIHLWLSQVGLVVIAMLDIKPEWKDADYRQFLQTFVIPAFVEPSSKGRSAQPSAASSLTARVGDRALGQR
jgi:AcrR family transcriptional regulator